MDLSKAVVSKAYRDLNYVETSVFLNMLCGLQYLLRVNWLRVVTRRPKNDFNVWWWCVFLNPWVG